jgi:hypothetical protein
VTGSGARGHSENQERHGSGSASYVILSDLTAIREGQLHEAGWPRGHIIRVSEERGRFLLLKREARILGSGDLCFTGTRRG